MPTPGRETRTVQGVVQTGPRTGHRYRPGARPPPTARHPGGQGAPRAGAPHGAAGPATYPAGGRLVRGLRGLIPASSAFSGTPTRRALWGRRATGPGSTGPLRAARRAGVHLHIEDDRPDRAARPTDGHRSDHVEQVLPTPAARPTVVLRPAQLRGGRRGRLPRHSWSAYGTRRYSSRQGGQANRL